MWSRIIKILELGKMTLDASTTFMFNDISVQNTKPTARIWWIKIQARSIKPISCHQIFKNVGMRYTLNIAKSFTNLFLIIMRITSNRLYVSWFYTRQPYRSIAVHSYVNIAATNKQSESILTNFVVGFTNVNSQWWKTLSASRGVRNDISGFAVDAEKVGVLISL